MRDTAAETTTAAVTKGAAMSLSVILATWAMNDEEIKPRGRTLGA